RIQVIGEVESLAPQLQRLSFPNAEVPGYGDVQLEDPGTFQVVVSQVALAARSSVGKRRAGISQVGAYTRRGADQPLVDALIGGIRVRQELIGGLVDGRGQRHIRPGDDGEE